MKKILLTVLLFSASVHADTTVPFDYVRNLHVYSTSGHVYFYHQKSDCSGGVYILPRSHISFDVMVSLLLAADMADRKVQLRISGCNSNSQGIVTGVYLD
ncbi:hypothetical protein [Agaribacterium haliotis]|uniref:hypothetical protein n=1 Tax=Agaribacterium haliotis TaxID=2013869 RepID=UPI000BB55671|nr:hypothetical protein [Agaribacterium haliotis]